MLYALQQFVGPVEVLLKLIRSKELELSDVQLLQLCRQLIQSLESTQSSLTPSQGAEHVLAFAQIAQSKIDQLELSIKNKPLESQEPILDWLEHVEDYARMKFLAQLLFEYQQKTFKRYPRGRRQKVQRLRPLNWEELCSHLARSMRRSAKSKPLEFTSMLDLGPTIQDAMNNILKRLQNTPSFALSVLFENEPIEHCICHFLAILELFKMHKIQVVTNLTDQEGAGLWIQTI